MVRTLLALLLAGGTLSGCGSPSAQAQRASVRATLHGVVPDAPGRRPHFTLTDTSGAAYDFFERTKGKVTLLFWGYTNCDDTCPAVLHDISLALRRVPAAVRRDVVVVFATSDPKRDSPRVVRRWLDGIDTSFVGLTGSMRQITAAEDSAGVPRAVRAAGKGAGYAVDHYAGTTAYAHDDEVAAVYPPTATMADYAADLPELVREES